MVPLGLGLPVHRIPFAVIILALLCTVKYIMLDIRANNVIKTEIDQIQQSFRNHKAFHKLRVEHCNLQGKRTKINCVEYGKYFSQEKKQKSKSPLKLDKSIKEFRLMEVGFLRAVHAKSSVITELRSYSKYSLIKEKYDQDLIQIFRSKSLLSRETQSLKNYFLAIFTHSSFFHLLGNMMALIAFGMYVEVKIGSIATVLSYLGAGIISSYVYINYFAEQSYLVGASGCISGIMGMFYVYFHKHYIKFWSFFKTFLLPANIYFPILYILNDVLMHLEGSSSVAAMAHIAGMVFGVSIALMTSNMFKTPYPFIYSDELSFFKKLKGRSLSKQEIKQAFLWLRYNPINYHLREKLITQLWSEFISRKTFSGPELQALEENTKKLIGRSLYHKKGRTIIKTLNLIPMNVSLGPVLSDFSVKELIRLYNLCLSKRENVSALRLSCVLLEKQNQPALNKLIFENIQKACTEFTDSSKLETIFSHCKDEDLRFEIKLLIRSSLTKASA